MNPLVTCICPTMGSRRTWLPKAIACFQAQTLENRRMLIVADFEVDIAGLIPVDDIRVSAIAIGKKLTIGEKRNLAVMQADSELIAHFDDDDFSGAGRLADQLGRLESTGLAVTGYHSVIFSDGVKRWKYRGGPTWAFDASLCYRKLFWERNRFLHINDGLEAAFRSQAIREKQFIAADAGDLMTVSIHDENTGPRVMTPGNSTWESLSD